MPSSNTLILLEENLQQAREAAGHLSVSASRCKGFALQPPYSEENLIELEALTSRFSRLSDILIQKIFKTIERLDAETPGTVRDRILQAEKKEIISSSEAFLEIRDMRNTIAHDYDNANFNEVVAFVMKNTDILLQSVDAAEAYSKKYY
jgi:uncharacterized protein YutE (UPF0331/DUF86 family)